MHTNNVESNIFGYKIQFSSMQIKSILSFFNISITGEEPIQTKEDWQFEDDWGGKESIDNEMEKVFERELNTSIERDEKWKNDTKNTS